MRAYLPKFQKEISMKLLKLFRKKLKITHNGFTFVELTVVIAITGIITTFLLSMLIATFLIYRGFSFLFKGGKFAQRPVMYIDGDESFTNGGIEYVIGNEVSMKREKDYEFFAKFE